MACPTFRSFPGSAGCTSVRSSWPVARLMLVAPRPGSLAHTIMLLIGVLGDQVRIEPEFVSLALLAAVVAWSDTRGPRLARGFLGVMWFWAGCNKALSAGWPVQAGPFISNALHLPVDSWLVLWGVPAGEMVLGLTTLVAQVAFRDRPRRSGAPCRDIRDPWSVSCQHQLRRVAVERGACRCRAVVVPAPTGELPPSRPQSEVRARESAMGRPTPGWLLARFSARLSRLSVVVFRAADRVVARHGWGRRAGACRLLLWGDRRLSVAQRLHLEHLAGPFAASTASAPFSAPSRWR